MHPIFNCSLFFFSSPLSVLSFCPSTQLLLAMQLVKLCFTYLWVTSLKWKKKMGLICLTLLLSLKNFKVSFCTSCQSSYMSPGPFPPSAMQHVHPLKVPAWSRSFSLLFLFLFITLSLVFLLASMLFCFSSSSLFAWLKFPLWCLKDVLLYKPCYLRGLHPGPFWHMSPVFC